MGLKAPPCMPAWVTEKSEVADWSDWLLRRLLLEEVLESWLLLEPGAFLEVARLMSTCDKEDGGARSQQSSSIGLPRHLMITHILAIENDLAVHLQSSPARVFALKGDESEPSRLLGLLVHHEVVIENGSELGKATSERFAGGDGRDTTDEDLGGLGRGVSRDRSLGVDLQEHDEGISARQSFRLWHLLLTAESCSTHDLAVQPVLPDHYAIDGLCVFELEEPEPPGSAGVGILHDVAVEDPTEL